MDSVKCIFTVFLLATLWLSVTPYTVMNPKRIPSPPPSVPTPMPEFTSTTTTSTTTEQPSTKINNSRQQSYENLSKVQRELADTLIGTFRWAEANFPLATTLVQILQQMSDTQLKQIPGGPPFLDLLLGVTRLHDMREKLRQQNVTGDQLKDHSMATVAMDVISKYNLTMDDIPMDKVSIAGDYLSKIPGMSSMIDFAVNGEADGVPFMGTILGILGPVVTEIPVSQYSNLTVISDVGTKFYHGLKPFAKHLNPVSVAQRRLMDTLIGTFRWAEANFPLATTLVQILQQMSDTHLKQIRGGQAFLDLLLGVTRLHDTRETFRRHNMTGDQLKNHTIATVVTDIISKYNLSMDDIPMEKISETGEYFSKIPGMSSLVDFVVNGEADGVPFLGTILGILGPVVTEIPVSQYSNLTVISDVGIKFYHGLKPFAKQLNPVNIMQRQLMNSIVATFKWADKNFPTAVRVLQLAKQMSDAQLQQIPGADTFLQIVSEALRYHTMRDKLKAEGVTGDQLQNETIANIAMELISKYNISMNDIPMDKIGEIGEVASKIPGISELAEFTMKTEVDGVPFLMTMMNLLSPIMTEMTVNQLRNGTVLRNISANAVRELSPYFVQGGNNTLDKLSDKARSTVMNLTELNRKQFAKMIEINRNLSHLVLTGADGFARNMHNYTHNTLGRVSRLNDRIDDLAHDHLDDAKMNWANVIQRSRNLTSNPFGVVKGIGTAASNFTVGGIDRMLNFTNWVKTLSWEHLSDLGMMSDHARDYSVHSVKQIGRMGKDVIHHTYSTIRNLSEITVGMTPLQMFSFASVEDLIKNRKGVSSPFSSMPDVGDLPGVSVIKALFDQLPKLKNLGFNQLMDFLNKLRPF